MNILAQISACGVWRAKAQNFGLTLHSRSNDTNLNDCDDTPKLPVVICDNCGFQNSETRLRPGNFFNNNSNLVTVDDQFMNLCMYVYMYVCMYVVCMYDRGR